MLCEPKIFSPDIRIFFTKGFFIFLVLTFYSSTILANQELSKADTVLNNTVGSFVQSVLNDSTSDFNSFIRAMMAGLAFIGLAWHAIMWSMKAIETYELITYVLLSILIFTFYASYNTALSEFWGWSDSIAAGIQIEALGTSDPVAPGQRLIESVDRLFVTDVSLWDGIKAVFITIVFEVISWILSFVVFVVSSWSIWGYAFCKITGLIFIPLLFIPLTRELFTKWCQIFLGFWFFNLFAKVILILYHLYFFAIFGAVATPVEYDPIADFRTIGHINMHFLVGILFMMAAGGLSGMMASGFGGIASRAGSGATKSIGAAAKFIVSKL